LKVLILGEGAREHSLGWKLKIQKECDSVFIHPGNGGTRLQGFPHLGSTQSLTELVTKSKHEGIGLVVIGPEVLLAKGYANAFREAGIPVVGPNREAAQLESSKIFAKDFFLRAGIPTANSQQFTSPEELLNFKGNQWPWVLKLDGLAAGKGVVIAENPVDVLEFAESVWKRKEFGPGPHRVLAESFLKGKELSYIGFCDGKSFVPLASATDYKRVLNANKGPNTGGMGAVSPSPYFSKQLEQQIQKKIICPTLFELNRLQLDYRGILFVGIMVDENENPFVLEFNTRFGDPETQCVLPRLTSSLLSLLLSTATGTLSSLSTPQWDLRTSVYVVACAKGYPGTPQKGDVISGLDSFPSEVPVFFGGVDTKEKRLITQGGRILGLGALEADAETARKQVYSYLSKVKWPGIHYRTDIGL
jgi:phosphoribosylamine--glycine ligase